MRATQKCVGLIYFCVREPLGERERWHAGRCIALNKCSVIRSVKVLRARRCEDEDETLHCPTETHCWHVVFHSGGSPLLLYLYVCAPDGPRKRTKTYIPLSRNRLRCQIKHISMGNLSHPNGNLRVCTSALITPIVCHTRHHCSFLPNALTGGLKSVRMREKLWWLNFLSFYIVFDVCNFKKMTLCKVNDSVLRI